jgi:hypothetical protein
MTDACRHGHAFTPDNMLRRANGWRGCRACQNEQNRKSYMRHRERVRDRRRRPRLSTSEKATRDCARFWAKVEKTDGCWFWRARIIATGYGSFSLDGRKVMAHRFAYELLVGPIPEDLELDHLCRVRHCVNPAHLEPVTHRENILRGMRAAAQQATGGK